MHHEIRLQDASSSDPPTTGSTVTRWLPKETRVPAAGARRGERARSGAYRSERPRSGTCRPGREEGRGLPYLQAREDRFRFPGARAHGPWPDIRGRHQDDPGSRRLPAARSPGNAGGPVRQHRPRGTPPRPWTELAGLRWRGSGSGQADVRPGAGCGARWFSRSPWRWAGWLTSCGVRGIAGSR